MHLEVLWEFRDNRCRDLTAELFYIKSLSLGRTTLIFGVYDFERATGTSNLTSGMPGMAHIARNESNFDISSKKHDVQKSVPQKCKTAWALGLKINSLIRICIIEIGTW